MPEYIVCYGQRNGVCEDDINTALCFLDGGDCCGESVNESSCGDCVCYSKYNLRSHYVMEMFC